jgi:probable rRNA maturation factor
MAKINFFSEQISFKLPHPRKTSQWIQAAIKNERHSLNELNFIFCTDDYLLTLNKQYLNHRTLTDIITFDTGEGSDSISGDVFISVERVKENALKLNTSFHEELHRVLIHGVLHLLGYSDKTPPKQKLMRKKEDAYLSLR